ncbi:MAG: PFL family protein [Phycisphaerae bacterium]
MLRSDDILSTVRMLREEQLDVRTVTLGINLQECASYDIDHVCQKIHNKIMSCAGQLVLTCDEVARKYGIPIVNKRLAISPITWLMEGHHEQAYLRAARQLDQSAKAVGVDLLGGFTALVQKGMTRGERVYFNVLPEVLASTERICASVNAASTRTGINVDAILLVSAAIKKAAELTSDNDGFGAAKLVVFANIPDDNPFMAGGFLGPGEPETVINIGVSGPGVIKRRLQQMLADHPDANLGHIAEQIKETAFRITRVGELIGREVAGMLKVDFGIVDLSLAPTPRVGDSVGEILQVMGLAKIGSPGTTAAIALLTDAVKKGGMFASSSVGGLSGAFIPVAEDAALAEAVGNGTLSIEKLEAITSICSVGLDMVPVPGDTTVETLASLIADELAIGVINNKTTAARIIPVPGKKAGEMARWGGLFGESPILSLQNLKPNQTLITRGGRIPAPIHSVRN